jgi:hypothetical protein
MRFFTTEGPVNPEKNYFVPDRFDEQVLIQLINNEKYFILHAPRQSGKTTCMKMFAESLYKKGIYTALYINLEPAQVARNNYEKGLEIILKSFHKWALTQLNHTDPLFKIIEKKLINLSGLCLEEFLQEWSLASEKPIVLFIDEIDSLVGDTLISVLRQLRSGYINRPHAFPQSVCLFGVRDVRDYRIWSDEEQAMIIGGSAFNIKAENLTLHDFSYEQFKNLYEQHTQETG